MSFSQNIKAQLAKTENDCDFCDIAELSAMVKLCTSYRGGQIAISTENEDVAERLQYLYERVFFRDIEYTIRNGSFKFCPDIDFFMDTIAQRLMLFDTGDTQIAPLDCCKAAMLRGAFFGGGSITDPKARYHAEIDAKHEGYAAQIKQVLEELSIPSKITCRKSRYIVYIKECDAIADMLGAMGAVGAAMDLYNISIEKQIRNSVNRRANCEIANIERITKTAQLQIDAIRKIENAMKFDSLPDTLKEIAYLRREYPEDGLKDLGERLVPPLGKSGVNHRLKRLMEIAEGL